MGTIQFYKQLLFFLALSCCYYTALSQQARAALRSELDKAGSGKVKADICFEISRKYADGLKIDSALYFANKIKEYSQKEHYETGLGKYHLALSFAFFYRGLNDDSRKNVLEAINILALYKNYTFLGIAYWQLGALENVMGNKEISRKNYWTSVHFLSLGNDTNGLFRTYFWLGRGYNETSDYDSSASYYIKALMLAEALKDKHQIYISAVGLGQAFLSLRDVPKAYQYLDWGLKNKTPTANKVGLWDKIGDYAICLSLLHNFSRADSAIREFEAMAKQFNHAWGWITLDKLKGILEYERQNYSMALHYFRNAYSKVDQIAINRTDIKEIVFNLAKTEVKLKEYDSAIVHLVYAAELSRSLKEYVDAIEADFLLSESYTKINKPDSALFYFRRYFELKESVLSLEKQKMLADVSTRYETEKKEQAIKILQKETEVNSYLLQLRNQEIEKQRLEDDKKSQQLALISQQNQINKLDADQKALSLDNEKKENEKKQAKLDGLEKESALQAAISHNLEQRKNFAYGFIAIILIFLGYGYYRYRQNKKLSNQLSLSLVQLGEAQEQLIKIEKEKATENIRVRISRDIHDEVGATLSGVALYSEIAKQKVEQHNEEEAQVYLDHISVNSKDMLEKMGDIIWTINPQNDSTERMVAKLKSYAANLCSGRGIQIHFHVDEAVKHSFSGMQERKNIYLLSKEAINNAVKYSDCSRIFYSIKGADNKIILEIKDDGNGFDRNLIVSGNGLNNIQARAGELNADLEIQSGPGLGTCIRLSMCFHSIGGQKKML